MCRDLHALDTSLTWVSGDRAEPDEQINNRQESPTEALATFYSKRSHDQCTCNAVTSYMTSWHRLMT